ncbi:MAG: DNA-binding protein [Ruminococcaceae bacterium]|nr:DNA-binding protein [Oscillospiraceae bacterium]
MRVLGFDTSNYTTSVASFDGVNGNNVSRLLDVEQGSLGLRQSDALFAHVKRLPELTDRLFSDIGAGQIVAIGASTRPRAVDGSYMPCFLAGHSQASVLASALGVPLFAFSHQQGHIAASLFSSEHMELMDEPHLAWHLSGGTTELLYVTPEGVSVHAERIGGTTDISAGQLIDRTGKLLGLSFPSGKEIDRLSREATDKSVFRVKVHDTEFSLSGVQNKVEQYHKGVPAETAGYALRCLIGAIVEATQNALEKYRCKVVFAGGVASNSLLREKCGKLPCIFCPPQFATDNALGTAVLTWRAYHAAGL